MTTEFLPFALPEIGEEEIAEVVDTLRSGWVTTGPKAKRFEADFGAWLGGGLECVAVNSATAGLHLGPGSDCVGPGDEVITTTHTFTATAEVVRYLGADPVFVDVLDDTLCIDAAAVEAAITPRTKAVIPVHFGGLAADMTALSAIARARGLKIVEDAAHALPTTHAGRLVGALDSDVTVFSFYANKTITTGEGGMAVTRSADLARRMRTYASARHQPRCVRPLRVHRPAWYYEIVAPGYKYNLTDIAAALGIHQLRRAREFQQRRQQIAEAYLEELTELPLQLPARAPGGDTHSWHLFVIRLHEGIGIGRDRFIEEMFRRRVGTSVHYIPLHRQPYWRQTYGLSEAAFPNSESAYHRTVSLPVYSCMTDGQVERVIATVKSILETA